MTEAEQKVLHEYDDRRNIAARTVCRRLATMLDQMPDTLEGRVLAALLGKYHHEAAMFRHELKRLTTQRETPAAGEGGGHRGAAAGATARA